MKLVNSLIIAVIMLLSQSMYAQKGKHKGDNKSKTDINININIDPNQGNDHGDHKNKHENHDDNDFGHHDNGWHHGENKHQFKYKNNDVIWFFGNGDIYSCRGKNKRQRIVIFDDVCVRLSTNIGFMFGFLGDIRINLDTKKAKMEPERYKKIKIEIDLLDEELKLIELKKNKIKIRLGKLKEDKD